MEDPGTRDELEMHLKEFEDFIAHIKRTRVKCDQASLYGDYKKHVEAFELVVFPARAEKLRIIEEEIDKMTKKKRKKYVSFENYEKTRKILETLIAEKNEFLDQREEYNKTVRIREFKMAKQSNQAKVLPLKSRIHLIGLEIIKELYRLNHSLPIYARRSLIVDIVERNQFVVLKGETGSGKSTQLPQYVMENVSRAQNMKVICTQPRKVAAISLAKRIAQEQFQQVGDEIGYWVGMNKCFSEKTKLLLMTDRALLNHCLENPQLDGVSCVIIDEAHERSINIDLLLGMVKAAAKAREDLKVIVTSATISTKLFSEYFYGCQVIEIPGRIYPVELMYEERQPGVDHVKKAVSKALQVHRNEGPGDILVFLTTPLEVEGAVDAFAKQLSKTEECTVLPLHGKLQPEDQMRVFEKTPNEARKVIFATNVAETSVTIKGIKFVIDCGLVKEKFYDARKGLSYLDVKMVSKSSAIQRMGRAGRTGPGICVRLFSKDEYEGLEETSEPEIKKMHLGSAVLSLMAFGISDVQGFDFIERPDKATLTSSINELKMLGAIDEIGRITSKGKTLAKLPLEPRAGNIVLGGTEAGCRDEAVILAAAMVYSSSVYFRPGEEEKMKLSDEAKVQFSKKDGDLLSIIDIYKEWERQEGKRKQNMWCSKNYINAKTMRSMKELIKEIKFSLKDISISSLNASSKSYEEKRVCLKELIISTNYDNVAFFTGHSRIGYWSPKFNKRFLIHPSSILCVLAMQPEFLVFQDVLKTSFLKTFITGLTPIDKTSLEALCPAQQCAIDFGKIAAQKVTETRIFPISPLVIEVLIGKRWETKNSLENFITNDGKFPGLLEMSVEKRHIIVYVASKRKRISENLLTTRINEQVKMMEDETKEIDIGQEKTGYRVLIKAGGEAQEILYPSESCKMIIEVKKRFESERIKTKTIDLISYEISKKLNELKERKKITKDEKDLGKIMKWGEVIFERFEALEKAKRKLNFATEGYEIEAKEIKGVETGHRKSNFRVSVTWSRRESRGFGFVKCRSNDCLWKVKSSLRYSKVDRKDPTKLYVPNIDRDLDNDSFKKSVEQGIQNKEDVMNSFVVYRQSSITNLEEEASGYERKIRNILNEISPDSIYIFEIKKQAIHCKANINCNSFEDAEKAASRFNGKPLLGTQKCKAVVVLKQEFFCKSYIYKAIAEDISEIVKMTENSTNKVTVDHGKKKGATIITLSGENTSTYIEVYNLLRDLVEGEVIHSINISQSTYNLMMKKIQNLEKEKQLGKIEFDKRNGQIRIYGNPKNRKLLEVELTKLYKKVCSNETLKIDLKGRGKRPGLMKELMRKYGPRLHRILPSNDCGIIELNIRQQMVSVSASVDVQKSILNLVNECNKELAEGNNTVHQENDDELDTCPLCLCPAEVPIYILQSCGHAYCAECLNQYIESCISDKKFPITCSEENCSRNLVIKDLDMLIQFKAKRANLVEASVGHFVIRNPKSYKYCPTPDCCMVYRITNEQNPKAFHCPNCSKSTCTGCHQNAHDAFQSCIAWKSYIDDDQMFKWAREHDARKCPRCNWMIEKNQGCMHMNCRCGAHICWRCMEVFETSGECYRHQRSCSGKFPMQTHRPAAQPTARLPTIHSPADTSRPEHGLNNRAAVRRNDSLLSKGTTQAAGGVTARVVTPTAHVKGARAKSLTAGGIDVKVTARPALKAGEKAQTAGGVGARGTDRPAYGLIAGENAHTAGEIGARVTSRPAYGFGAAGAVTTVGGARPRDTARSANGIGAGDTTYTAGGLGARVTTRPAYGPGATTAPTAGGARPRDNALSAHRIGAADKAYTAGGAGARVAARPMYGAGAGDSTHTTGGTTARVAAHFARGLRSASSAQNGTRLYTTAQSSASQARVASSTYGSMPFGNDYGISSARPYTDFALRNQARLDAYSPIARYSENRFLVQDEKSNQCCCCTIL